MRPAAILGTMLAIVGAYGCFPHACNDLSCESLAGIVAHLPVPQDNLAGASVTFCRNGSACAHGVISAATAAGGPPDVPLTGAFDVDARLTGSIDGYVQLSVYYPPSGPSSGNFADGDSYAIKVVDASNATLIDVTRRATYSTIDVSCDGPPQLCYSATLDVYPTSASGIQCTGKDCISGVTLQGTVSAPAQASPLVIQVCRNQTTCAQTDASLVFDPAKSFVSGPLTGALAAGVALTQRKDGRYDLSVRLSDDPAGLHDGDAYSVTVTVGSSVVLSGHATATYDVSYPNGMQCDAVPCRSATLTLM